MENVNEHFYARMVAGLAKPGAEIVATLTAEDAHQLHMAVGIAGEAGELLDAVKKAAIYRKPIDRANVVEELGDLEFYMEGLRQGLGITREEVLAGNISKLSKRYATLTYSDSAAQQRADKAE
jgi:NTP pyrophosphatase (non-canonical NTP hydrolase)